MEDMQEKARRTRRSFSDEYKAEVVDLVRRSEKSPAAVARDLGLVPSAVRRWVAPLLAGRPMICWLAGLLTFRRDVGDHPVSLDFGATFASSQVNAGAPRTFSPYA